MFLLRVPCGAPSIVQLRFSFSHPSWSRDELPEMVGSRLRFGCRRGLRRCSRHRLSLRDNRHLLKHNRCEGLVVAVAIDASDSFDYFDAGVVALTEKGIVLTESWIGLLCNKELASVGIGPGIRHGQASRNIEIQIRI